MVRTPAALKQAAPRAKSKHKRDAMAPSSGAQLNIIQAFKFGNKTTASNATSNALDAQSSTGGSWQNDTSSMTTSQELVSPPCSSSSERQRFDTSSMTTSQELVSPPCSSSERQRFDTSSMTTSQELVSPPCSSSSERQMYDTSRMTTSHELGSQSLNDGEAPDLPYMTGQAPKVIGNGKARRVSSLAKKHWGERASMKNFLKGSEMTAPSSNPVNYVDTTGELHTDINEDNEATRFGTIGLGERDDDIAMMNSPSLKRRRPEDFESDDFGGREGSEEDPEHTPLVVGTLQSQTSILEEQSRPNTYRLLGNLWLPDPSGLLSRERCDRLKELEPHFRDLDGRADMLSYQNDDIEVMRSSPTPARNKSEPVRKDEMEASLLDAWEDFKVKEAGLFPSKDKRGNVYNRWSGSLDSRLSVMGHYPPWPRYGHKVTTDSFFEPDNSSIRLFYKLKGFPTDILACDAYCKREGRDTTPQTYSDEQRQLHLDFFRKIQDASESIVELVWGSPNRKRILNEVKDNTGRYEQFNLWGDEFDGVKACIEWLPGRLKPQMKRLCIFMHHPEYWYRKLNYAVSRAMDQSCNAAARISGIEGVVPDWFTQNVKPRQEKAQEESITRPATEEENMQYLRELVQEAMEHDFPLAFQDLPPDLEPLIRAGCFRQHKTPEQLLAENDHSRITDTSFKSAATGITAIMLQAEYRACEDKDSNKIKEYIVRDKARKVVAVWCKTCHVRFPNDTDARWWSKDPSTYIVHTTTRCQSVGCIGKERDLAPILASTTSMKYLKGWHQLASADPQCSAGPGKRQKARKIDWKCWRPAQDEEDVVVKVKCSKCGAPGGQDEDAQYTVRANGADHPRFVAKLRKCEAEGCTAKKNPHGIPLDDRPFWTMRVLKHKAESDPELWNNP